jgi:2-polyprenyl-3-methyl-5-hydroxy-6-metoxy-1,4-benzoquinol methylase
MSARSSDQFVARDERDQQGLVHRLPRARVVDRIPWLVERVRGRRVVHVGFADAGFRSLQQQQDRWLHAHLAEVARELVGVDLDADGVEQARADGYEAHVADCCDPEQVAALGLAPAEVVLAGEIIEHLDAPGSFLDAMRALCAPDGVLVLTTPNAYGWVNPLAAVAGIEVNHPDHIVMFTWRTLHEMLRRHGWEVVETATYVPTVKAATGRDLRSRVVTLAARVVVAVQRLVSRVAPFVADGLIVVARPARA